MTSEEAKQEWLKARNFNDLCQLCERFITGNLTYSPTTCRDKIDSETEEIKEYLVKLNRNGLFTLNSQPGVIDDVISQRACVVGFALEKEAFKLAEKTLYTDVNIQIFPIEQILSSTKYGYEIPVTLQERQPTAWVGTCADYVLDELFEPLDKDTSNIEDFVSIFVKNEFIWYVTAVDLAWGRKDHLWEVLLGDNVEGYSVKPHPYSTIYEVNPDIKFNW